MPIPFRLARGRCREDFTKVSGPHSVVVATTSRVSEQRGPRRRTVGGGLGDPAGAYERRHVAGAARVPRLDRCLAVRRRLPMRPSPSGPDRTASLSWGCGTPTRIRARRHRTDHRGVVRRWPSVRHSLRTIGNRGGAYRCSHRRRHSVSSRLPHRDTLRRLSTAKEPSGQPPAASRRAPTGASGPPRSRSGARRRCGVLPNPRARTASHRLVRPH